MIKLLNRVEKYINFEEILKFTVGIEILVSEPRPDKAMKRKEEKDRYDRHNKRPRFD